MRFLALIPLIALFLVGCGGGKNQFVKKGELSQTIEQQAIQKENIEAVGICGADAKLLSVSQKRSDSRDCAITKAQGELATTISGIELEGGVRVERAVTADSVLQSKLQAALKGAEIVKTEWLNDDGCVVTMRINRKRLQEMMGVKFK